MLAFHCSVYGSCKCAGYAKTWVSVYGGTGGFTIPGTTWASGTGKLTGEPKSAPNTLNAEKPGPKYPCEPSCCPVSKNTPPPPCSTVSYPDFSLSEYEKPRRGAKLYQVVFQSGVPCGARVSVSGEAPRAV